MSPLPDKTRPGEQFELAVDVKNGKPGDSVKFIVAAGSDVIASLKGELVDGTARTLWMVDPGTRGLPLAVAIKSTLHGQTVEIGQTTIVSGTGLSTLGWLDEAGRLLPVDTSEKMRVAQPGDTIILAFDVHDGAGRTIAETLDLTFIVERDDGAGGFRELNRSEVSATGVPRFRRSLQIPKDLLVPATIRVTVEAHRAGEAQPDPSLGRHESPPVRVLVRPPLITTFSAAESTSVGMEGFQSVGLGPGQSVRLSWVVHERFDEVRIEGLKTIPVTAATNLAAGEGFTRGQLIVDPAESPPDSFGEYAIIASNLGFQSNILRVSVVAITELVVRMAAGNKPGHVLLQKDRKTLAEEIRGVARELKDPERSDFLGQITPGSKVALSWKVAGADLHANRALVLEIKGLPPRDVTQQTIDGDGAGSIESLDDPDDPSQVLDVQLLAFVQDAAGKRTGAPIARAMTRLRENREEPRLKDFIALDGSRPAENGVVSSWANLRYQWTLTGDPKGNRLSRLMVKISSGTESFEEAFKPAGVDKMSGDAPPTKGGPFKGEVFAEARLVNTAGHDLGEKIRVKATIPDSRPVEPGDDLEPPKLEVGFNYPWPFNRYGTTIGPRDIGNDPPTGANDTMAIWRDKARHPPEGSLAKNLKILRDELKIRKVRMFLLGNAFNYGKKPITGATPSGKSIFTAPPQPHPLFLDHFKQMLEVFQRFEMQILPSLIDFGAFYPLISHRNPTTGLLDFEAGGGRTSILTSERPIFLRTVLSPMLEISKQFRKTVFAWEVINEPVWNTIAAPLIGRPHTSSTAPDADVEVMASFIADCLKLIKNADFQSTVGHRFLRDLTGPMPTGDLPQFHYYAGVELKRRLGGISDPDPIPKFEDLARDSKTKGAFVGEFGVAPGGEKNQFNDEEPGAPWPACEGKDKNRRKAAFERLKILADRHYELAFVWPDRSDKEKVIGEEDELKLSADAKESIKEFTTGKFPKGIPP